jgi:hypothetical protein
MNCDPAGLKDTQDRLLKLETQNLRFNQLAPVKD